MWKALINLRQQNNSYWCFENQQYIFMAVDFISIAMFLQYLKPFCIHLLLAA